MELEVPESLSARIRNSAAKKNWAFSWALCELVSINGVVVEEREGGGMGVLVLVAWCCRCCIPVNKRYKKRRGKKTYLR